MKDLKKIKRLSVSERILMVEAIWDSIKDDSKEKSFPLTQDQEKELAKRIELYESGKTKTYTWQELKMKLQSK